MTTHALRTRLLEAQLDLVRRRERAVVVLLTGHAVTHKGRLVNELDHWLENRHTEVHALEPRGEERERPYWWRYWRRLPDRGRIAIFIHGWYGDALFARAERRLSPGPSGTAWRRSAPSRPSSPPRVWACSSSGWTSSAPSSAAGSRR